MRFSRVLLVRVVAPIVGATILVLLVGLLSVRAHARVEGLVIDFTNTPTGLTTPGSPWLQYLGIAVLVAAGILFVWPRWPGPGGRSSWLAAIVMGLVLLALSAWFLATADVTTVGHVPALSGTAPGGAASFYGRTATDPAILTWLRAGALSPAIHAVIAVCFIAPFLTRRSRPALSRDDDTH